MVREARAAAAPPAGGAVSEGERFARLWQQTQIPPPVSAIVARFAGLSVVCRIPPERLVEAMATWRELLVRAQGHGGEDADDLVQLTMALALEPTFSNPRIRAMAEVVLETVSAARDRHAMLALLANSACRESDAEGAVGWLRLMDPRSDELRVDSPYRACHAAYETLRGGFAAVIALLGMRHEDVPMHPQWVLLATILRANAFAKMGDPGAARAQIGRLPASSASAVEYVVARWPALALLRG